MKLGVTFLLKIKVAIIIPVTEPNQLIILKSTFYRIEGKKYILIWLKIILIW